MYCRVRSCSQWKRCFLEAVEPEATGNDKTYGTQGRGGWSGVGGAMSRWGGVGWVGHRVGGVEWVGRA